MSFIRRLAYVIFGTVANSVHALIYLRIGEGLFAMSAEGGAYEGPFSSMASMAQNFWLLAIIVIQIGLLAYLIYGGVREERARGVVPR